MTNDSQANEYWRQAASDVQTAIDHLRYALGDDNKALPYTDHSALERAAIRIDMARNHIRSAQQYAEPNQGLKTPDVLTRQAD